MTIRKMTIEDYDEVYSLWLSCTGMGLNNLDDSNFGELKKQSDCRKTENGFCVMD